MSEAAAIRPQIKVSWFFGIFGAFLIFAAIAGYSSRMAQTAPDYDSQRAAARYATLQKLREDDQKTLTTADWVDKTKQIVRIPIQEAMAKELDTLRAKPVQMGAAIPGTTPAANIIPAAAKNQAPAGAPKAAPSTNAPPATPPAPAAPNK